jgi:RNA polymerase sigma-70 factor (ECF subfamily)
MYINKQDDLDLINSKNPKDLNKLYKKYSTIINGIFFSKTKDKNQSLDMTQEVLIKIHNNLHKFDQNKPFNRWVYQISINHFLDQKRALNWNKGYVEFNQISIDCEILRETLTYVDYNEFSAENDLISEVMGKLDNDDRFMFDLYFNKNQKISDISKTMSLSKAVVSEKIKNLINKIKKFNLESLAI